MKHHFARLAMLMAIALGAFGQARAATPLTMQAGSSSPSAIYTAVYIAQKAGFFAEEDLDVTVRYSRGGSLAAQLAASGDADIAHIVFTPIILGHENGLGGKFFYQTYTHMMYFLAARKGSDVKSVADLKGKKIGVFSMGSAAIYVTKSMAHTAGIDDSELQFLPVSAGTQALAALDAGMVDVLALWDSVYGSYEAAGESLNYIYHPTLKDVGNGGFFASDKVIAEKADALKGFSRAIAKATVFLKANPEAAARIYWDVNVGAKQGGDEAAALKRTAIEMQFVAEAFDVEKRPNQKFGELDSDDIQANIDLLKENKLLTAEVKPEDIVTEAFVPAANDFDVEKVKSAAKSWTFK